MAIYYILKWIEVVQKTMSLTSIHSDASAVHFDTLQSQQAGNYNLNQVAYMRQYPTGLQPVGISANRQGNGAAHVDVESMLRNQSFVSSSNPQYRSLSDQCVLPFMHNQEPITGCVPTQLTPQVNYHSRACDPMSGVTIDRFDPLIHPGAGFQYGYAAFGEDTVATLKDQLERQRPRQ